MLFVAVALYFVIACLVSWVLLFPGGREFVMSVAQRTRSRMRSRLHNSLGQLAKQKTTVSILQQTTRASTRGMLDFLRAKAWLCAGGAALITLPPLFALLMAGDATLGGFDVSTRETNTQVAALLEGEQLVPPPALPPAVFTTVELQQERPMLASASRDWVMLRPEFAQRLLMAFKIMKEQHGYDMAILEGYRSPQRQNMLASMGSNVTNAAAFQSWHQYGLAADCAFLRDGKIVISEKDPWAMRGYQLYGQVAESLGLTWGGRWKMMDFGHTELRVQGVMKK